MTELRWNRVNERCYQMLYDDHLYSVVHRQWKHDSEPWIILTSPPGWLTGRVFGVTPKCSSVLLDAHPELDGSPLLFENRDSTCLGELWPLSEPRPDDEVAVRLIKDVSYGAPDEIIIDRVLPLRAWGPGRRTPDLAMEAAEKLLPPLVQLALEAR